MIEPAAAFVRQAIWPRVHASVTKLPAGAEIETRPTLLSCQFGTMFTEPHGAACRADEAPSDHRPRLVLGQGIQPDIDHASIALAARALDVAGHVAVGDPFCGSAERVNCRSIVSMVAAMPSRMIPRPAT